MAKELNAQNPAGGRIRTRTVSPTTWLTSRGTTRSSETKGPEMGSMPRTSQQFPASRRIAVDLLIPDRQLRPQQSEHVSRSLASPERLGRADHQLRLLG